MLLEHPGVYDAAVIGVQFKKDDSEFPRAYIIKKDNEEGKKLDANGVMEYMGSRLAKFKRPDGGVVFVDEIVRNLPTVERVTVN